jgi:hypothetical protein
VIITITSFLAVVSLLIRNWLFIFWKDFDNAKELQIRFLEGDLEPMQEAQAFADDDTRRRQKSLIKKRSNYI